MKKIFAVTKGSYSDWSIIALFSNKGLAEEYISRFSKIAWNPIEEFELDRMDELELARSGYHPYKLEMLENGDVPSRPSVDVFAPGEMKTLYSIHRMYDWEKREYIQNKYKLNASYVWAKSPEHAVKITNEKRIHLQANGFWKEGVV